jgi:hypothetical protein
VSADSVVIPGRFNGPPNSGNGGYVCGVVAGLLGGSAHACAQVTLRAPAPLDRPLQVHRDGSDGVQLRDGERLIAEGRPGELDLEAPAPPSLAEARAAAQRYTGFVDMPFPTCFTCGPDRHEGDGLRIFTGLLEDGERVAAPWRPHASVADAEGAVRPEILWAALDCPSGWAVQERYLVRDFPPDTQILLGQFEARLDGRLRVGESAISLGWPIGREGRKLSSGSALFREDGSLLGLARATWIAVLPKP